MRAPALSSGRGPAMKKHDDSKGEINEPGPWQLARLHHERNPVRSDADRGLAQAARRFPRACRALHKKFRPAD